MTFVFTSTNHSPTSKSSVKIKTGAAEKTTTAATAARADAKGRGTPDHLGEILTAALFLNILFKGIYALFCHLVSKPGSSMKKPASPKREDREVLKSNKAGSEAPKKITKPASASGSSAKSSTKPAKASSAPSKPSSAVTAKSGPKPKGAAELSTEKSSPKAPLKTSAAAASKKSGTKGKEAVNGKLPECKTEPGTTGDACNVAEKKDCLGLVASDQQSTSQGGGLQPEPSPKQNLQSGEPNVPPAANSVFQAKPLSADACKQTEGSFVKQSSGGVIPAHVSGGQVHEISSPNSPRDTERHVETPCSVGSTDTPLEDSWSGIHHQVSPESDSGSTHTTSSDDIKPRSEDYDAGGSQDDDGSNDRGVSKCGTMRCHDFLGRSSSDTSTPEELKMYEGGAGLRVEVRLRGRDAETTSEEEGLRRRPQRDEVPVDEEHSEVEATVTVKSVPDHQLFSSEEEEEDDDEEETEDEKSEVEVILGQGPVPPTEPSPQFQGIVNLAFDDEGVDQENEPEFQSTSNFRRSVLLSVDECEELGSEEGSVQTPPQQPSDAVTPCDVFECDSKAPSSEQHNHLPCATDETNSKEQEDEASVFLTELQESAHKESNHIPAAELDADARELPPQERPCHLDLRHTEQYNGGLRKNPTNPSENKKADLHLDLKEPQLTGGSPVHAAQSPAGNV